MPRRKSLTGTRRAVLLLSKPTHRLLIDFLSEVEAGVIPSTATVCKLAEAFEHVLFESSDVSDALGLKIGKGRPRKRAAEQQKTDARDRKIVRFIESYIAKDTANGNVTRGIEQAAQKFGKVDRHIWRAWRQREKFRRIDAFTRMLAEQQRTIDAYAEQLTPKARATFLELDGRECYQIAHASRTQK